jgi:hypothetical protein
MAWYRRLGVMARGFRNKVSVEKLGRGVEGKSRSLRADKEGRSVRLGGRGGDKRTSIAKRRWLTNKYFQAPCNIILDRHLMYGYLICSQDAREEGKETELSGDAKPPCRWSDVSSYCGIAYLTLYAYLVTKVTLERPRTHDRSYQPRRRGTVINTVRKLYSLLANRSTVCQITRISAPQ